MSAPPLISTPRLTLTWPAPEQIDGYYNAIIGTDIFDTLIWDGPTSPGDLHDYWKHAINTPVDDLTQHFNLAVIENASSAMIGGISWRPVNNNPEIIDIGYAFAKPFHGRGYATEAVGALTDFGFRNRRAERVFATVFVDNVASRRVLEKCGFAHEGTLRRAVCKRGQWRDEWMLAITRPQWSERA